MLPAKIAIVASFQKPYPFLVGEEIKFASILKKPTNSGQFDYVHYLLLDDTYGLANVERFDRTGVNTAPEFSRFVFTTREFLLGHIRSVFPGDSASLLGGILLGERSDFSIELKNQFARSGLTHIVAVSGFNITIIILFLSIVFSFLPNIPRSIAVVGSIVFFVFLVGPQAPVLRAAILGIVGYVALLSDRRMRMIPSLLTTALLLVWWDPLSIVYDVSFHLSFLAVLGIISFSDRLDRALSFLPSFLALRESLVLTLSATVFTLPIMLVNF